MAKKKSSLANGEAEQLTFEQSLAELEKVVHQLEDGELSMDEALASYEHGIGRLQRCYQLLDKAEKKIEQLIRVDDEGNAVTKPFPDDAAS